MALGYRSYHVHKISGLLLDPDFYVDFGETRTHQLRSDGLVFGYFLPEARLENPEATLDQIRSFWAVALLTVSATALYHTLSE